MNFPLRFFNTLTRSVESFSPLCPPKVGMYTCGPTVYSTAHIGNMRSYIFADLLKRTLNYAGLEVFHVMNITDVGHLTDDGDYGDDKIESSARKEGKNPYKIAEFYTNIFFEDAQSLNIQKPSIVCKATDHIAEQIALIEKLQSKGLTYVTHDGVYFRTELFKNYGKMVGGLEGLKAGHRVEVGEKLESKDFALWKFHLPESQRLMVWPSPWGEGFPGWHIECSAMAMAYLGESFDIHTGGVDHIPVHHTNEIAQSEGASGTEPFVRFWMHGEFLLLGKEKISKSSGRCPLLTDITKEGFDALAFRYLCLTTHYRKQQRFHLTALKSAQTALTRLKSKVQSFQWEEQNLQETETTILSSSAKSYETEFQRFLGDDLDVPGAIAHLWGLVEDPKISQREKYSLIGNWDKVFGLNLHDSPKASLEIPEEILKIVRERENFKNQKAWKEADFLRDKIASLGYHLKDTKEGPILEKISPC